MDAQQVLKTMRHYQERLNQIPRGQERFNEVAEAYNQFMFAHLPERDFNFIMSHLDHNITNPEAAALVAASYNKEDISEVISLDPEVKLALKFRIARNQKHLTQAEVARRSGSFTQGQVAKAEAVKTSLSIPQWDTLFKAIGSASTLALGI
ncbi:helix-turn-helix domain-containing protein [Secundilactobacillus similis]|uniref:HTH cro/C1-type domain-containing protein n=1 Tax=Secundilactobacillus similis DSM 23365 = JCM 2765 TaxID=1423804 RepID=A0A0R2FKV0_9LACO|nr:helix-turn-helix transcriptional regulator [Secundilactobacillus similis]KRN25799.1 hypothetical protein FD14_GL000207 [Secundilactobacillus similis DSM 23365 = JCM 2765]